MLRRVIAVVIAALIVLAMSGVASGHVRGFDSQVTIRWQDDVFNPGGTFSGRVTSAKAGCVPGRTVKVFYVQDPGDDLLVGSDTTDGAGEWTLVVPGETSAAGGVDYDGTYYARVARRDLRPNSAAHDHICRADRSQNLPVNDEAI